MSKSICALSSSTHLFLLSGRPSLVRSDRAQLGADGKAYQTKPPEEPLASSLFEPRGRVRNYSGAQAPAELASACARRAMLIAGRLHSGNRRNCRGARTGKRFCKGRPARWRFGTRTRFVGSGSRSSGFGSWRHSLLQRTASCALTHADAGRSLALHAILVFSRCAAGVNPGNGGWQ